MPKIVLVEDNDALREVTLRLLLANNMQAWGLSCAEEVDEFALTSAPDIFLIDLGLPSEDGLQLAQRVRAAQPEVGIIMITGRTTLNHRLIGYENGADVYLPKPVDPDELLAVIDALYRRISGGCRKRTEVEIDVQQLMLVGPAGQQSLTHRECLLLSVFARAKEQTLERWQILQLLDTSGKGISSESMEVLIGRLRKKLSCCLEQVADLPQFMIKSIRGYGYRVLVPLKVK